MELGTINEMVYEDFTVVDSTCNLVIGINVNDFTVDLYDPDGLEVSVAIPVTISELGNGNYRSSFTPNKIGTWYLVVYHPLYFPWGKAGTIQVYNYDFNSIGFDLKKVLGLVHENIYIDEPAYDEVGNLISARLRIYSTSASVGTNNNIIATYRITADPDGPGKFVYWQQVKE